MISIILITTTLINLSSNNMAVEAAFRIRNWPPVLASTFTPMSNNCSYKLNLGIIPVYAKYLKEKGIDGVIISGATGEGVSLNLEERMELSKAWVLAAKPLKMVVIVVVGAGLPSTENFKLVQYLEEIKVDAIMALPYLYYRANTPKKAVLDLKQISEYAPETPILYYDRPKLTGVYLNMVEFYTLASSQIQSFIGIKCSLETAINITAYISLKNDEYLIVDNHQSIEGAFKLGFNTTSATLTNLFPELVLEIEDSIGTKRAAKYQDKLNLNYRTIVPSREVALPTLKAAFSILTCIDLGRTKPPLYQITYELKKNITRKFEELGIKAACPVW